MPDQGESPVRTDESSPSYRTGRRCRGPQSPSDAATFAAGTKRGCIASLAQTTAPRAALLLLAVLLPAAAGRLWTIHHTDNIAPDGTRYLHMAHMMSQQGLRAVCLQFDYAPGYPVVVSAVARACGASWPDGWLRAGQWVSFAAGLLALVALYFVAKDTFDRRAALITVLLVGVSSWFIAIGVDVLTEALVACLVLTSAALGLEAARRLRNGSVWTVAAALGAGLAAGGAYLVRPEGLAAAGIAGILLLKQRRLARHTRRIQLAALLVLVVAAVACVLPYALTIGGFSRKKTLSDLVLAGSGGWPMLASIGVPQVVGAVRKVLDKGRDVIGTPPAVLAIVCWSVWLLRALLGRRAARGPARGEGVSPLRLAGILPAREVPAPLAAWLPKVSPTSDGVVVLLLMPVVLVPILISLVLHLGPAYISGRHAVLIGLLASPCAGAGVLMLAEMLMTLGRQLGIAPRPRLAVAAWTFGVFAGMVFFAFPTLHEGKDIYRLAGLAIRDRLGAGALVLADDARAAFFAEAPDWQFVRGSERPYDLPHAWTDNPACRPLEKYAAVAFSEHPGKEGREKDITGILRQKGFRPLGEWTSPNRKDRVRVYIADRQGAVSGQHSAISNQHSAFSIQHSATDDR